MRLGTVIRDARKARGLTQRELAEKVGRSAGFVNDLEHHARLPGDEVIESLAVALELDRDLLFHRAGRLPLDLRDLQPDATVVIESYKQFGRSSGSESGIVTTRVIVNASASSLNLDIR